jgi:hypothetical protein
LREGVHTGFIQTKDNAMTKLYAGDLVELHPGDPGYDQGHPLPPHVGGGPLPPPFPGVWPPLTPDRPSHELPEGSPILPGTIWPGARPGPGNELPSQKIVVLCWISGGIGWNYVVVDPSLSAGLPLPEAPAPKS